MNSFMSRKKLANEYEKWRCENNVKDCAMSAIAYLEGCGLLRSIASNQGMSQEHIDDKAVNIDAPARTHARNEGSCPVCGCDELIFKDSELRDGSYVYDWTCFKCKAIGEQVFDLVFITHVLK